MTNTVQQDEQKEVTQEQQEQTQTPEQEEASFAAGYHKAKGTEPTAETEQTEKKDDAQAGDKTETKTTEPAQNNVVAQAEPVRVFGLTEQEFKTALTQAGQSTAQANAQVRQAFGKIGEISRTVQQLQATLSAAKSGRKIDPAKLKRVNEELPGLGAALAQDLSDIFGDAEQAQATAEAKGKTFDPDKYHTEKVAPALAQIETRMAEASEQLQESLLAFMHPDFDSYLKTDEFKKWLQTLPEKDRNAVVKSPLASVAGKAIKDSKDWNAAQKKTVQQKTNKLAAAISPKGTGAAPAKQQLDEEASLRKGYERAKGR